MSPVVAYVIGIIAALVCTIILYAMVMPKKKDGQLPKFWQFIHNYFHFKQLYIEVALKFLFTLATIFVIVCGFFMLFCSIGRQSTALTGLLLMILGPVVLRLVYELSMMFILLVQNVIEINKKTKGGAPVKDVPPAYDPHMPVYGQPVAQGPYYCPNCGTPYDPNTADFCRNCGATLR